MSGLSATGISFIFFGLILAGTWRLFLYVCKRIRKGRPLPESVSEPLEVVAASVYAVVGVALPIGVLCILISLAIKVYQLLT